MHLKNDLKVKETYFVISEINDKKSIKNLKIIDYEVKCKNRYLEKGAKQTWMEKQKRNRILKYH